MTTRYHNYVDGTFATTTASYKEVTNPATHEILALVPETEAAEVDAAVAAARRAQPAWEKLPAVQRAEYLRQISAAIRQERTRFRDIIVQEQGKTQELAQVEVDFTANYIDYMAEWARRIEGEVIPSDRPDETILLTHKPLGVVAGILPWNFPFFLIARKLAPALLTGNTIVIKPADETPINAFEFARLVDGTDLPAGVFNLVGGSGRVTGEALISNPDVDLITFTGSVSTGKHIMQVAGKNLTRVNLELGGKAPAIVLADADLDLAAKSIWQSRIINTGQVCNCAEKVYVERSVHDQLVSKLTTLFETTRFGNPSAEAELDMGPLINDSSLEGIASAVEKAKIDGATVITGGKKAALAQGFHYEPTLLTDVTSGMSIMREETFGPVLPIQAVDGLDEAITLANDSDYGLTSSIYTTNINAALRAAKELQYGETYINRENFEAMQGFHAGRKQSGIGGADGKHGLMEFTETHVVYIQGH
ncbi:aldehyde dehydrogenase [Crystallibacter degradans]|uniref:aldehyde dehydrogenase n=1 Tax=Crystallibacter degradans TaxID=2726743 RepID=UPI001475C208|nr:aldehyde dehydrogenase [Arthrobacter sp. SF27]NMR32251.1 aldehyde dehydrogenase [Arthrobacter sp. SF27]